MRREKELRWGKSTVETACPLDCPDNCTLAVSVEKGRVVGIDGGRRHSLTDGYICAKVRGFAKRVYGDDRLHHPGVRVGPKGRGEFARVTWDEALNRITAKIREVKATTGGEAILPFYYGGSNGLLTQDTTDAELFRRLGTSQLARTVCAAATGAASQALYGKMPGVAYQDYRESKLIVLWGENPNASSVHLVPHIREAQRRGAALVVIDPRRTPLAKHADVHLALRPGTDVVVALALHRYLFENGFADETFLAEHTTGASELQARAEEWTLERAAQVAEIEVEALERVADLYATTSPAVIRCGWGLERNRNGGHAVMAVLALPAVGGKFGVRGGGYSMTTSAAWTFKNTRWIEAEVPQTRVINMNQLGRVLTEPADAPRSPETGMQGGPPIELLFVYNCNPVATIPHQNLVMKGLLREDLFTVVFDQVKTDTAMYADIVLPATTFLESYDIARSYGSYAMQIVQPAIDAVGESRSNMEVFSDLATRLNLRGNDSDGADHGTAAAADAGGFDPLDEGADADADADPFDASAPELYVETDAEVLMRVVNKMPEETRDALLTEGIAVPPCGPSPVQFVDIFPNTADRKVHLFPAETPTVAPGGLYSYQPDPATSAYPLALISPASEKTVSSTLGELRTRIAALYMHPRDAAARSLEHGDPVRVFNDLGEVHCLLHIGDGIAEGTVSLPKGLWRKSTMNRATANALAPDTLTDVGGGATFNDARVEVTRIVDASWAGRPVSVYVPGPVEKTDTVH